MLLFLAAFASLIASGAVARAEKIASEDVFIRGNLRCDAVETRLRAMAGTPGVKGLLAYALSGQDSVESKRLYQEAPEAAYVLLGRADPVSINKAYAKYPNDGAVREAIGLEGDFWSRTYRDSKVEREGVPTYRNMLTGFALADLRVWTKNPFTFWRDLPVWRSSFFGWLALFFGIVSFVVMAASALFVPRPKGTQRDIVWRRGVQLFFPGSPWFSQGWGVVILLAFAFGLWLWRDPGFASVYGLSLSGLALALHLTLWLLLGKRQS